MDHDQQQPPITQSPSHLCHPCHPSDPHLCTVMRSCTLYMEARSSFSTVRRALQLVLSRSLTTWGPQQGQVPGRGKSVRCCRSADYKLHHADTVGP
jgi:hypothetical protein